MFGFVQSLRCDCSVPAEEPPTTLIHQSASSTSQNRKRRSRHKNTNKSSSRKYSSPPSSLSQHPSQHTRVQKQSNIYPTHLSLVTTMSDTIDTVDPQTIEDEKKADNDEVNIVESFTSLSTDDNSKAPTVPRNLALPEGYRWATSHPNINFTGKWVLIVTDEFKQLYKQYLTAMGYNALVRKVASSMIGRTKEETIHFNDDDITDKDGYEPARKFRIRSINPKGVWDRTYISSGESSSKEFTPLVTSIKTANGDAAQQESWWEKNGSVHKSYICNTPQGDFESLRYFEEGSNQSVLVCDSIVYAVNKSKGNIKEKAGEIVWRFKRVEGMPTP